MDDTQQEILDIFKETGALLSGHFILRSGERSAHYFQCARVCEHLGKVERLAKMLLEKVSGLRFDTILAPAMGGLVLGQEVARLAGKRYLYVEKAGDVLELRRGFKFSPGERVLVVEDVITRGGRVRETLDIVAKNGAEAVGLAVLVDRSEGRASFGVPLISLLELSFPTYPPDAIPEELRGITPIKPGS